LPNTIWAADPIIGTWKLDLEKSKLSHAKDNKLKDVIRVYKETEGNMIESTQTYILKDGSTRLNKKIFPKEGGVVKQIDVKIPEDIINAAISVGSGDWYFPTIVNGRKTLLRHTIVSKDGKTIIETIKGINYEGKTYDTRSVYDRQ
jgi:hypothetical protein